MTRLILVRHASTNDNNDKKLSGHIDSEVSIKGKEQIIKLTKYLEKFQIDSIYSTTSSRTKETISEVSKLKNLEIKEKKSLKEINFGKFEGLTFSDIELNYNEEINKMINEGNNYTYPDGESLIDSYNRVVREIDTILEIEKNKSILICSHGGTIRNIITYLIANTHEYHWNFKIDNASVTIIDVDNGFAVINTMNQTEF